MILTVYLDESGTHGESPHTVMGGMMANDRQWETFERKFRHIKKKHRFRIFHTKKFKRRDGDFRGWSNEQCLALIADLAPITATAFTEGVTFLLDNAAYDTEYRVGEIPASYGWIANMAFASVTVSTFSGLSAQSGCIEGGTRRLISS